MHFCFGLCCGCGIIVHMMENVENNSPKMSEHMEKERKKETSVDRLARVATVIIIIVVIIVVCLRSYWQQIQ